MILVPSVKLVSLVLIHQYFEEAAVTGTYPTGLPYFFSVAVLLSCVGIYGIMLLLAKGFCVTNAAIEWTEVKNGFFSTLGYSGAFLLFGSQTSYLWVLWFIVYFFSSSVTFRSMKDTYNILLNQKESYIVREAQDDPMALDIEFKLMAYGRFCRWVGLLILLEIVAHMVHLSHFQGEIWISSCVQEAMQLVIVIVIGAIARPMLSETNPLFVATHLFRPRRLGANGRGLAALRPMDDGGERAARQARRMRGETVSPSRIGRPQVAAQNEVESSSEESTLVMGVAALDGPAPTALGKGDIVLVRHPGEIHPGMPKCGMGRLNGGLGPWTLGEQRLRPQNDETFQREAQALAARVRSLQQANAAADDDDVLIDMRGFSSMLGRRFFANRSNAQEQTIDGEGIIEMGSLGPARREGGEYAQLVAQPGDDDDDDGELDSDHVGNAAGPAEASDHDHGNDSEEVEAGLLARPSVPPP